MTLKISFRWYDLWIGSYWDRVKKILYICPVPCIVLAIAFTARREGRKA